MNNKYQKEEKVYFYTMIDRVPGVIFSVEQKKNGNYYYDILVAENTLVKKSLI